MAGLLDALTGGKTKDLEERMLASIQASRELSAQLRNTQASIEKLCTCLHDWCVKAEEIKKLAGK